MTPEHTGQYIFTVLISDVIEKVGPEKVGAVITDNAANMQLAWQLLKQKYPNLITYGCQAHGLNLLIRDILKLPTMHKIVKKATQLMKYFTHKSVVREALKIIHKEKLGKTSALQKTVETICIIYTKFTSE